MTIKKFIQGDKVYVCNPLRDSAEDIRLAYVGTKLAPGVHNVIVAEQWPTALIFKTRNEAIQAIIDKLESMKDDNQ
jgi:hypothetical protein